MPEMKTPIKEFKNLKDNSKKLDGSKRISRSDFFTLETEEDDNFMETKFQETDEGYLQGRAIVTNVGVFPYLMTDGTIRWELRPPEEVFDVASIASLQLKPITHGHPSEIVTKDNISEYQKGYTGDDVREGRFHLSVPLNITDGGLIQDIKEGKNALSCGYTVDIEEKQGVWMGMSYDAIQRNIRYNHIAAGIDQGRAGDDVKIKMDKKDLIFDGVCVNADKYKNQLKNFKEDNMSNLKKVKIDNVDYDAEVEVIKAYNTAVSKIDAANEELAQFKKDYSTLEAERDSLKDSVTQLKGDIENLKKEQPEKIDAAVKERINLENTANKFDVEVKDEMSNDDIKKAVILKASPNAKEKLDSADEVYVSARYDGAVEYLEERGKQDETNSLEISDIAGSGETRKTMNADEARQRMIERMKNPQKAN